MMKPVWLGWKSNFSISAGCSKARLLSSEEAKAKSLSRGALRKEIAPEIVPADGCGLIESMARSSTAWADAPITRN